jgi:hypothetical protein
MRPGARLGEEAARGPSVGVLPVPRVSAGLGTAQSVERRHSYCEMANASPTSVDPASGFYWRASQWVSRRAREGIRDALGYDLPITFASPPWTKRSPTPGALCWSRHLVQSVKKAWALGQ